MLLRHKNPMAMSSRERVLTALDHQEPDRVPLDLGAESNTGIAADTYTRLRDRLGIHGEPARVFDVEQMLAWVEMPVVQRLGVDVLPVPKLSQAYGMRIDSWRSWQLDDGTPVQMPAQFDPVPQDDGSLLLFWQGKAVAKKAASSPYFDGLIETSFDLQPPPVESLSLPILSDEDLVWARRWAEKLRAETDKAILADPGVVLTRWGSYQEWLYMLAADPDYVHSYYERKLENMLTNIALYAQAVGDHVDIVRTGEDYGTQQGMMISPASFENIVAPYYARFFDWIHTHTSWKVFFHCCGGIYPIIQKLIDIGIDILNPVQTTAAGMDPTRLKQEFGDQVTFWGGGIETQTVLPFGTREEIRAQVKERISTFGKGGGFVFCPIHNIQPGTPVDSLLAMYEAVQEFAGYPGSLEG
jgi:uroporphyrinogen decarboxylase